MNTNKHWNDLKSWVLEKYSIVKTEVESLDWEIISYVLATILCVIGGLYAIKILLWILVAAMIIIIIWFLF